jgi:hypothetical protein
MNKFRLRPAYGSKELLIEFTSGAEKDNFIAELENALFPLKTIITGSKDLWVNDEILFEVKCNLGTFQISIDNYGLAFILSKKNQEIIKEIDSILSKNKKFKKELVDFINYQG